VVEVVSKTSLGMVLISKSVVKVFRSKSLIWKYK
jgi:hypothetical protein